MLTNWWTAAIDQSVRLFIEKTAAGTRIVNTVSVLRINHKEINLFYSALFCSSPQAGNVSGMILQ